MQIGEKVLNPKFGMAVGGALTIGGAAAAALAGLYPVAFSIRGGVSAALTGTTLAGISACMKGNSIPPSGGAAADYLRKLSKPRQDIMVWVHVPRGTSIDALLQEFGEKFRMGMAVEKEGVYTLEHAQARSHPRDTHIFLDANYNVRRCYFGVGWSR